MGVHNGDTHDDDDDGGDGGGGELAAQVELLHQAHKGDDQQLGYLQHQAGEGMP